MRERGCIWPLVIMIAAGALVYSVTVLFRIRSIEKAGVATSAPVTASEGTTSSEDEEVPEEEPEEDWSPAPPPYVAPVQIASGATVPGAGTVINEDAWRLRQEWEHKQTQEPARPQAGEQIAPEPVEKPSSGSETTDQADEADREAEEAIPEKPEEQKPFWQRQAEKRARQVLADQLKRAKERYSGGFWAAFWSWLFWFVLGALIVWISRWPSVRQKWGDWSVLLTIAGFGLIVWRCVIVPANQIHAWTGLNQFWAIVIVAILLLMVWHRLAWVRKTIGWIVGLFRPHSTLPPANGGGNGGGNT